LSVNNTLSTVAEEKKKKELEKKQQLKNITLKQEANQIAR
jgi:hypothetical protein